MTTIIVQTKQIILTDNTDNDLFYVNMLADKNNIKAFQIEGCKAIDNYIQDLAEMDYHFDTIPDNHLRDYDIIKNDLVSKANTFKRWINNTKNFDGFAETIQLINRKIHSNYELKITPNKVTICY